MHIQDLVSILGPAPVIIQTHNYPDPDALASAYGLQRLLQHFGVDAKLCHVGSVERASLEYIVERFGIDLDCFSDDYAMAETDQIILVDGQKFNANMTDLPGDEIACIDHHPTFGDRDCGYKYSDIRIVGACSSLIASYYFEAGVEMPKEVATILLYGLQTDTDYMTRGVKDLDIDMFSKLYAISDHAVLHKFANKRLELGDLRAFAEAINAIKLYDPQVAFARINFACPDALLGQIADFILSLAEVDTAIIYCMRSHGIKFSARTSEQHIHCGNLLKDVLAPYGGGGGHASMAGGFAAYDKLPGIGPDDVSAIESLVENAVLENIKHQ